MSDLDKLIAAVEADADEIDMFPAIQDMQHRHWFAAAHAGSLDAAMRLHEALLPGWEWTIDAGDGAAVENRGDFGSVYSADASVGSPARAWLLAILLALKSRAIA